MDKLKLIKIIEKDDLESFKINFNVSNWKESITKINNYASINKNNPDVTLDNVDCLRYSVHCEADKIFDYLLSLPEIFVDKTSIIEYGFPLLGMAIKRNRYDYANKIVNHKTFSPRVMYHINKFTYIDSNPDPKAHIELLFNYLTKFKEADFYEEYVVDRMVGLACYNEETYNRFNDYYKSFNPDKELDILDMFRYSSMKSLGDEIFNEKYNPFVIEKLSIDDIDKIVECALKDYIYFSKLFESEHAVEGIKHLLKSKNFKYYCINNEAMIADLCLEGILLLEKNGVDLWEESPNEYNPSVMKCAMDYILDEDKIEKKEVQYFINNYTQKIYDKYKDSKRKNFIVSYCHKKLLEDSLLTKQNNSKKSKI